MELNSSSIKETIQKAIDNPPKEWAILLLTLGLLVLSVYLSRSNGSLSTLPVIFGVLIILELAYFVGKEVKEGTTKNGWKGELLETFYALIIAVVIWQAASFLLNTNSPVSAVASCSMLPNLDRGDFVIVQGSEPLAYQINMSAEQVASLTEPAAVSYSQGNVSISSTIFAYCQDSQNRNQHICNEFYSTPQNFAEKKGALTYHYGQCQNKISGQRVYSPCVETVEFEGIKYETNFSHDVIVYQPKQTDLFARVGDIVHRAYFRINAGGREYYLTRGDNNPVLDIQIGNSPIEKQNMKGKVIARIPYLGYFKLLISGLIKEDAQCSTQLTFDHSN